MAETDLQYHSPVSTAVVSRPGIMEQSLRTWLATCADIVVVASYGDGLTALTNLATLQPELLVIDANLLDREAEILLCAVKSKQPTPRCLVLIRSSQRQSRMLTAGADAVVPHDDPPHRLQSAVSRLAREARAGSAAPDENSA